MGQLGSDDWPGISVYLGGVLSMVEPTKKQIDAIKSLFAEQKCIMDTPYQKAVRFGRYELVIRDTERSHIRYNKKNMTEEQAEQYRRYMQEYMRKNRKKFNIKRRDTYANKKRTEQCTLCKKKAKRGYTMCEACLKKRRAYAQNRRKKK